MSSSMFGAMSSSMSGAMTSSMSGAMSSSMSGAVSSMQGSTNVIKGNASGPYSDDSSGTNDYFSTAMRMYLEELALTDLMRKFDYMIYVISFVGIFGNTCSILVLIKQGFGKSSNILLFSLAVAENINLIAEVSRKLFIFAPEKHSGGYQTAFRVINSLRLLAHYCSMTFPVLITIERLVAVLLPLKFKVIVTPGRVCLAVILDILIKTAHTLTDICQTNSYIGLGNLGQTNKTFLTTECMDIHKALPIWSSVITFWEGVVATSFVTVGCIIIGVKVAHTMKKRSKMTSRKTSQSDKTTITLLSVLVVYIPSSGFYVIYSLAKLNSHKLARMFLFLMQLLLTINSSCNCFIYVFTNSNFRKDLKTLFRFKRYYKGNNIHVG